MIKLYVREVFDENDDSKGFIVSDGSNIDDQEVFFESQEICRERWASTNNPGLISHTEDGDNQWTSISEIRVPTEHDKQQLLLAFKYLHDCYIDTDLLSVNTIVHMYQCPEKIKVTNES